MTLEVLQKKPCHTKHPKGVGWGGEIQQLTLTSSLLMTTRLNKSYESSGQNKFTNLVKRHNHSTLIIQLQHALKSADDIPESVNTCR
jgi:hypothetical protein